MINLQPLNPSTLQPFNHLTAPSSRTHRRSPLPSPWPGSPVAASRVSNGPACTLVSPPVAGSTYDVKPARSIACRVRRIAASSLQGTDLDTPSTGRGSCGRSVAAGHRDVGRGGVRRRWGRHACRRRGGGGNGARSPASRWCTGPARTRAGCGSRRPCRQPRCHESIQSHPVAIWRRSNAARDPHMAATGITGDLG